MVSERASNLSSMLTERASILLSRLASCTVWALNAHRYRFRHREFHFALNWLGNCRFGGSQFSGMIRSADFGGRTPVLSCSLWLEGTRSGSPGCAGPVPHP